uniref:Retrotransposon gag domain-containing protein n=1 Tax=Chromera velia CCMP2878 TaxID=1169474 RepID=A0A0G4HJ89_9ALVE|eukprot:Cvel_1097.t1-p1 / transcript=Cvel_1097.t1 / gene=Cvel_1097 / organism=Chromera_velia_CCMP2878 / gene_product=hypothetical protein / transcript_product=hypothetical protein / location=Cvel_scaffold35:160040-161433(-) / protein_length=178 / sequence_SO=supercontig / SO=protein_coding / is_pseudo=false
MEKSIARAKLQALRCTEALRVEKYNEAFSQLVGQLPHLWEEDVVEDCIKGLPNSIALDVAKVKTHTLLETQKEAAEIEAFLSSRVKGGRHQDFHLCVPESRGMSGQRNQPLVPEEGPIPIDLCGIEMTNSSTWGAESFKEGDQNANGSGVCALCAGTPSNPKRGGLPHSTVADKILSQ